MIAATLGPTPPDDAEARRFSSLIRMPSGQRVLTRRHGRGLLVQPGKQAGGVEQGLAGGAWSVVLAGQLHNRRALAQELGLGQAGPEEVYAAALEKWGELADEHCVGHYAAIAVSPDGNALRLARSPFQAPPLHFRTDGDWAIAAQYPRTLFWREAERPAPDLERVAQMLVNDGTDRHRSWYLGAHRLPLGSAAILRPQGWSETWRYDLFSRPQLRLSQPGDYAEAANALLAEGVKATLEGAAKPAILLSGGLDSPLVASHALDQLPAGQNLHAFTFGPDRRANLRAPEGVFLSDFDAVQAFAARHPRIQTHFETNPGKDFRHRLRDLLEASDGAPAMLGLAWIEQDLYAAARAQGCDVMLCGTWGNFTFSSRGPWAFSEFLVRGKWRQLRQALEGRFGDPRPLWRRFAGLSLAPLLPREIWSTLRHPFGIRGDRFRAMAVRPDFPGLADILARSRRAGFDFERIHPASKTAHWRGLLSEDGQDQDQYALGMELLHGLPKRDPTAYRPLVEFCWGCPTEVFMRAGQDRWLAREMAKGRLPEQQRLNRAYGHQNTDWQARLAEAKADLVAELERMADDPEIAALVDLKRLRGYLDAMPQTVESYDPDQALPYQATVPIGMAAARFIAYAKGRNDI